MSRSPADEIALAMVSAIMSLLSHLVRRGDITREAAETVIDKVIVEIEKLRASAPPMRLESMLREHVMTWLREIVEGLGDLKN
jgi:polyhydroxyalkanoate synthesis regulator phasin